ncbi:hypothetical protein [Fundidesulfovibrio terrae]|uniref:hypothetical protein n=1 Tax=Fundidesulfovibrio terrae TaxID=2922866 RepID=UPI001FAF6104|nr:hypothetical protein [Fundidesulfovibrio terrae]
MLHFRPSASPLARLIPLLAILAMACAGCSAKLSAAHLQLKPWEDGGSQKLYAKFMHFDFKTQPHEGGFEVTGTAWPIKENIPPWADSVDNLSINAYLCNEHGDVLVSSTKNYPAQKIPASGFPFQFVLKHVERPSGGFYVSFGYGGMFTASKPPTAGGQGSGGIAGNYVFYVSEQAALKK